MSKNPFNYNNLPSIFAFPKDGNSWRVDWFGDVAFPNRLVRRKQPSILVHLSRIVIDGYLDDPSLLLSPESTFVAKQRKLWVSVGTLPLLCIGDIWRDGQLEMRPEYELECFSDVQIDGNCTSLIKAGLNLEENGFLLPRSEHPWHMQCTQSYCLMVDLPDNRRLIIPCVELTRFYFGSSSNLLTKLFLPPLSRESLYSNPRNEKASGRLSLQLAENISGASAADIGRLHLDPHAWRAAVHVGTSLLKASLSGQGAYPQAFFPFDGQSTLIATGKWLSFGEQPKATFLVFSLRSCSHPFPFRSLKYETVNARQSEVRGQHAKREQLQSPTRRRAANDSPDQSLVDQDASNSLARKSKQICNEVRFPDLIKKSIWKNTAIATSTTDITYSRTFSQVQHASVGDPGSERRVRPIDLIVQTRPDSTLPVPNFLRETVDDLKQLKHFRIDLLTNSDEDGWTVPITISSDEDGEIDLGLFIESDIYLLRPRRVSAFSINHDGESIFVVAIESFPAHVKIYASTGGNASDVWQTLDCAAADFIHRPDSKDMCIVDLIGWIFEIA